jgi:hypothetical protein
VSLTVVVERERSTRVDLGELIPSETAELLYEDARGERTLAVSSTDASQGLRRRVVTRYAQDAAGWRALDETTFTLDAEYFSEVEQRRAEGGPNLHLSPIRLPRVMSVGVWHHPIEGHAARVALSAHAWVRLRLGSSSSVELPAIAFLSSEARQRGLQWSVLGVGEVWNGPPQGPPTRWLVGGRVGARALLGSAPASLFSLPRIGLPAASDAQPRRSVL